MFAEAAAAAVLAQALPPLVFAEAAAAAVLALALLPLVFAEAAAAAVLAPALLPVKLTCQVDLNNRHITQVSDSDFICEQI